jgi:hypothetical protein
MDKKRPDWNETAYSRLYNGHPYYDNMPNPMDAVTVQAWD